MSAKAVSIETESLLIFISLLSDKWLTDTIKNHFVNSARDDKSIGLPSSKTSKIIWIPVSVEEADNLLQTLDV